jgi:WD40 repeat-containing protein SMU1
MGYLVTGTVDGFIEVWDWLSGKIRKDLTYQAEDKFMIHDEAVFCLAFSRDSEMLVSGSQDGKIKVWRVTTGKCLRKFDHAHSEGVTCVCFGEDSTHILSGSFDHTVRIHGLKSGRTLKIFRGHTSFVNGAIFVEGGSQIISASSDGTLKVWDSKTTDCLRTFSPTASPSSARAGHITEFASIHSLYLSPSNPEHVVVGTKTNTCYLMSLRGGKVLKTYSTGKKESGAFVRVVPSRKGGWIYAVAEDGVLYCFNTLSGALEASVPLQHEKEVIGIVQHPHRNLLASFAEDGTLKLWTAE